MALTHDRKIKVVHFAISAGGVKRHLLDIAYGYDREHFEMIGVFPDVALSPSVAKGMDTRYKAVFSRFGVAHHILEVPREIAPVEDIAAVCKLATFLRKERPDIIHCHSSKAGYIGRIAVLLSMCGCKTCFTPHVMYYTLHTGVRRFIYYWAERVLALLTDKIIAVSQSEYEELERDFPCKEKLVCINNGVNPPNMDVNLRVLRQEHGISPETIVILSPTRCEPQKDVKTLILAMAELCKSFDDVMLLIAGEGGLRPELEELTISLSLQDKVTFLGWVDDIEPLMAVSDIVALSSVREGMPYALLEAAAMGKPLVGSNVPGICNCIIDGKNGFLIPQGESLFFAEKLLTLCRNEVLRKEMGQSGIALTHDTFNCKKMISQLEGLYAQIIS